jgi:type III secretion protein V
MIVAQVTTKESKGVGSDIGAQVFADYRTLRIAAVVVTGFALIPGMPMPVLMTLAAIFGGSAYLRACPKKS